MPNNLISSEIKKALEDVLHRINGATRIIIPQKSIEELYDVLQTALDLINRYEAEVEKLITLNSKLEGENYSLRVKQKTIKAEAYEEFAEKIKEKTKWLFSSVSINNEVDNILNELDGDDNE